MQLFAKFKSICGVGSELNFYIGSKFTTESPQRPYEVSSTRKKSTFHAIKLF